MHWGEFYELIEKLQRNGHLPAFLLGALAGLAVGLVAAWFVIRRLRRRPTGGLVAELRSQIADLTAQSLAMQNQVVDKERERQDQRDAAKRLEGQIEHQRKVIQGTTAAAERKVIRASDLSKKLKSEQAARLDVSALAAKYSSQLDAIMNSDGKIWLQPAQSAPPFLPLHKRRTAIISIANLKGGVGKTTLTANLGAALANQGLRVLLVDLDHQSSLTNFCVTADEKKDLLRSKRYIDDLFDSGGDLEALNGVITKLEAETGTGQLYLAPVREEFADLETRLMTQWHSGQMGEDARFRLRRALHSARLRDHYDVVLIDCPPRWTTGSINALAASDYVLIPVLLEETSADAVPRILGWLRKFQSTSCGELNVLGVVGNRANPRLTLIKREQSIWNAMIERNQEKWGDRVHHFAEIIRDHPSVDGMFAALDPRHQPRYDELVQQIRKVIPHARLEPARVPASDGASVGGVGA